MKEISVFNRVTGSNIFDLDTPDDYGCSVFSYRFGLTTLELILHAPETDVPQFLIFGSPIYFEGPTTWRGANFFLGSDDELTALLGKTGITMYADLLQKQMFIEGLLLFKTRISSTESEVRIIATNALLSDKPITFQKKDNSS